MSLQLAYQCRGISTSGCKFKVLNIVTFCPQMQVDSILIIEGNKFSDMVIIGRVVLVRRCNFGRFCKVIVR